MLTVKRMVTGKPGRIFTERKEIISSALRTVSGKHFTVTEPLSSGEIMCREILKDSIFTILIPAG